MGRPIATGRDVSSGVVSCIVAQTVASVGPYSLNRRTRGRAATCCSTSRDEQLSPATITVWSARSRSLSVPSSWA
jgi:hypothetical protein